jgi:hypothetical protein
MVDYIDCSVGVTLELRVGAVFRDCFKLSHYRPRQSLRAPHEGGKLMKLYIPAASFLLKAKSIPGP